MKALIFIDLAARGPGVVSVIPIALAPSKCLLNAVLLDLEDSGPLILIDGYAETT